MHVARKVSLNGFWNGLSLDKKRIRKANQSLSHLPLCARSALVLRGKASFWDHAADGHVGDMERYSPIFEAPFSSVNFFAFSSEIQTDFG